MSNLLKTKSLPNMAVLFVTMIFVLSMTSTVFGQATSFDIYGYRANEGGGGALDVKWTKGNLGNTWAEGEWVPYKLVISNIQTNYLNMAGFPDLTLSFDFTSKGNRFVDLIRGIQVSTSNLDSLDAWPDDFGNALPLTTLQEIDYAQNDIGNTGDLENVWSGFSLLRTAAPVTFGSQIESLVNRDLLGNDGDSTDERHTFTVPVASLIEAGIPTNTETIVIYFQLHESRSFIWFNGLQSGYDAPPSDDWGGYLYSLPAYAGDARNGAGYVPGSSGHIHLENVSGSKDVPIPIPERLPGAVSGLKWHDEDGNGMLDGAEQTLSGWRIYVSGTLEGITFSSSTETDGLGNYSFPNLTSNVIWSIREDAQRYDPPLTGWMQTYPLETSVFGVGTGFDFGASGDTAAVGWKVALTVDIPDQGDMNFGNKLCQVTVTCPPDATVDCLASTAPANTGYPLVDANCAPTDTVYIDNSTVGDCDIDGYIIRIERTWIVTDAAGIADTCTQIITVVDTTPPVITGVGADDTLECPLEPVFSDPSANDDCSTPVLTYVDDTTFGDCPEEYSVTRTWTATDDCGNTSTDSQTIWIEDNTAPVISGVGPADTIECPATPVFSDPSATDACDLSPSLTFVDSTFPGDCPEEYYVKRTWTATDACGNSSSATQTIWVEDNTAPVISGVGPADTIECPATPVFSDPSASDACDPDPSLTYVDSTFPGDCPQEYYVKRTWTATDACGNSSSDSQTIWVEDNTAPVISGVGDDDTIECPATPVFSDPSASDACDPDPSLTYVDSTFPGDCPQEYSIKRTWTATDGCGNSSSDSQTIWVEDNAAPVISGVGPADTVECPVTPQFSNPTASDDCDPDPALTYVDSTYPGSCPYEVKRTWTATDACGNSSTASQSIWVDDTTPPVISGVGPADTVECPATPVFSDPSASDACDPDPSLTYVDSTFPGDCPQEYYVKRTWTATDGCGNSSSASQTIWVVDDTAPVISGVGPADTVECPTTPVFSTPSAADACDPDPSLTFVDSTFPGDCPQEYYVKRTWTSTDACGNSSSASQTIWVEDNTAPVISGVGDDDVIDCPATPEFSDPSASDVCDPDPSLTFVDSTFPGDCPQEYSVKRTWTATDACDNSSTASQTITVQDTLAPTIVCAADDTVACEDEVIFTAPYAEDNCDPTPAVIVVATDTTDGPAFGETTYTRYWYATDACGNVSDTCSQSILQKCPEPCTFTIGGWGSKCPDPQQGDMMSSQPGCIRDHYFGQVFPGGYVTVGHTSGYMATWTSAGAIEAFLPNGGTPDTLDMNYTNPMSTSGGILVSQILALRLNSAYSCAGVFYDVGLSPTDFCYGEYTIPESCGKFAGLKVDEFLMLADKAVSGNLNVLNGYSATLSDVNYTAACLNERYSECDPYAYIVTFFTGVSEASSDIPEAAKTTDAELIPTEFSLGQNHPNPFNPVTQLTFALPQAANVKLEIFNVVGQKVATVVNEFKAAGYHTVTWDGSNSSSGVYFYRLQADSFIDTKKMMLLK